MESLVNFIKTNSHLEKLLIQHNDFGPEPMKQLAEALEGHNCIKYLDVSANAIRIGGFMPIMEKIISGKIPLHTF